MKAGEALGLENGGIPLQLLIITQKKPHPYAQNSLLPRVVMVLSERNFLEKGEGIEEERDRCQSMEEITACSSLECLIGFGAIPTQGASKRLGRKLYEKL